MQMVPVWIQQFEPAPYVGQAYPRLLVFRYFNITYFVHHPEADFVWLLYFEADHNNGPVGHPGAVLKSVLYKRDEQHWRQGIIYIFQIREFGFYQNILPKPKALQLKITVRLILHLTLIKMQLTMFTTAR